MCACCDVHSCEVVCGRRCDGSCDVGVFIHASVRVVSVCVVFACMSACVCVCWPPVVFACPLADWLTGRLADRLAGWLAAWLLGWLRRDGRAGWGVGAGGWGGWGGEGLGGRGAGGGGGGEGGGGGGAGGGGGGGYTQCGWKMSGAVLLLAVVAVVLGQPRSVPAPPLPPPPPARDPNFSVHIVYPWWSWW